MCTAVTLQTDAFYFGRNLDLERGYGEYLVITPRRFPLWSTGEEHYALIGVAHLRQGYPLYYDAVNERGLCMAGLRFVHSAVYHKEQPGRENVPAYQLLTRVLGQCATVREACGLLKRIRLTDTPFAPELPAAPLHWLLADSRECVAVEPLAEGLQITDDPAGVLTNEPPLPRQLFALNDYLSLSPEEPVNRFAPQLKLRPYSRGMGALGLPGDLSSASRFVRVAFVKQNSVSGTSEEESVSQFFHILGAVEQQRGCCEVEEGKYELTIYTSCCNVDKGIYYYTTYGNHQITAVDMYRENLDSCELKCYPLVQTEQIRWENGRYAQDENGNRI